MDTKAHTGTFTDYPTLVDLPQLVADQRLLEGKVATLEKLAAEEKALRDRIDALLRAAGVKAVTCNGYDVVHNPRAGRTAIDRDRLLAAGVSPIDISFATTTGKATSFVTVRPMMGAQVAA